MKKQQVKAILREWRKDIEKDTQRENAMDDERLDKICQYRIQYEPYSWCDLSDNICLEDSGNSSFDTICENNTAREEKK